jgi:hypothetical protein
MLPVVQLQQHSSWTTITVLVAAAGSVRADAHQRRNTWKQLVCTHTRCPHLVAALPTTGVAAASAHHTHLQNMVYTCCGVPAAVPAAAGHDQCGCMQMQHACTAGRCSHAHKRCNSSQYYYYYCIVYTVRTSSSCPPLSPSTNAYAATTNMGVAVKQAQAGMCTPGTQAEPMGNAHLDGHDTAGRFDKLGCIAPYDKLG